MRRQQPRQRCARWPFHQSRSGASTPQHGHCRTDWPQALSAGSAFGMERVSRLRQLLPRRLRHIGRRMASGAACSAGAASNQSGSGPLTARSAPLQQRRAGGQVHVPCSHSCACARPVRAPRCRSVRSCVRGPAPPGTAWRCCWSSVGGGSSSPGRSSAPVRSLQRTCKHWARPRPRNGDELVSSHLS